jgi:hypothetical protein
MQNRMPQRSLDVYWRRLILTIGEINAIVDVIMFYEAI